MKDTSEIPTGIYCYTFLGMEEKDGNIRMKRKLCPYWSRNNDQPEQQNGYCSYLEKGDWEEPIPDDFPPHFPVSCLSLLWDQVKDPECPVQPTDDWDENESN